MVGQGALFSCFVHLEAVGLIARGLRRFGVAFINGRRAAQQLLTIS
jgi:hypothetical protein